MNRGEDWSLSVAYNGMCDLNHHHTVSLHSSESFAFMFDLLNSSLNRPSWKFGVAQLSRWMVRSNCF
jgi:hypothetical protein